MFYYAGTGRIANLGANPYLQPPMAFHGDPFDPFDDWRYITTPYGPIWTLISRALVGATGADPFATSMAFKLVIGLAALGLGVVTYRLALRLTADRRRAVGAFVLVAWYPALLRESAGTAHLDAVVMLFALGGLLVMAGRGRGATTGGLLLVTASVLVKPVTLPLLALAALNRLHDPTERLRTIAKKWALDATAIGAVSVLLFAPFWDGLVMLRAVLDQQRRLYLSKPLRVNPFWDWLLPVSGIGGHAATLFPPLPMAAPAIAQRAAQLLLLGSCVWLIARLVALRRAEPAGRGRVRSVTLQVRAWAVVTAALALLPVNAHVWYTVWAVAPMALVWAVGRPRSALPRWLVAFLAWSLFSFLVYHTWPSA